MPSLTFLGAAGTVTGSKHLLDIDGRKVLVDCGLFQGLKELRLRNWAALPLDASKLDAVVLTHAHLDHCGYLPRLVAQGYRGRIYCTPGTRDLCTLVLPDSAHLQEEDARRANRRGYSKHSPALPLYSSLDAARALTLLQPVGYDRPIPLGIPGVEVEFVNAGHLLGSAYARLRVGGKTILFGGDLGRYDRPVLPDPAPITAADVLLVESTYGDRVHGPNEDARLAAIIGDTVARRGKLIIPAFAIGRTEEVVYWIKKLEEQKRIPILPVYIDSPMAAGALQFYAERINELDPDLNHGNQGQRDVSAFYTARMTVIETVEQSKAVMNSKDPAIVIAASGMATGGRVLHHLAAALPDSRNTVMFVGFQSAGTRGRLLCDGAKQIKMLGQIVDVVAKVERLDSMSAHADSGEILRWLKGFTSPPQMTFIVHGEPHAAQALEKKIQTELKWPTHIAQYLERVELS